MSAPPITVYLTGWCPYCERARHLLNQKGFKFQEVDVGDDPSRRAEMIARSGRHTVPQIFIGERHIGGCDDLLELDASGELEHIIQGTA